ncbi:MAG: hypothetical protein SGI92_15315, partial [Bryobacteraceae bacterium]|nr:hypothetical protein [Bryobacteraceae bacterium]
LLLLIGAFLFLKKKKKPKKQAGVQMTQGLPAATTAAALANAAGNAIEGEPSKMLAKAQERVVQTARIESLVDELRAGIASDPLLAASVLRTWLDDGEPSR